MAYIEIIKYSQVLPSIHMYFRSALKGNNCNIYMFFLFITFSSTYKEKLQLNVLDIYLLISAKISFL